MTSIHTNTSAIAALHTLRSIATDLSDTQNRVSSGLRVQTASDNSAYWSISTTMRSDHTALSTVTDALGLAASIVDVAYLGLTAVIDVLGEFKAKVIASKEPGVDKAKIQTELNQLKDQVKSISRSASFNGINWLTTDIADIYDVDNNKTSVVSTFGRGATGIGSVSTMEFHLSEVSLFNSTGGGLLEPDARDVQSIAGLRPKTYDIDGTWEWSTYNPGPGFVGSMSFNFSGPLTFANPSDKISFQVTVDADDPATGVTAPYNPGHTSLVTIDRTTVDAVNPAWNGEITTNTQYAQVLNHALSSANSGAYVSANYYSMIGGVYTHNDVLMSITTQEDRSLGLDGSYVEVSNFSSTVGSGGLGNGADFGVRATNVLNFQEFQVYKDGENEDGISINFSFSVNAQPATSHSFDRTYVNDLLGKDSGKVETVDEMVTLLQSLIQPDWPDVIIETSAANEITIKLDPAVDRLSGGQTSVSFSGISVSIEPISKENFEDIDIVVHPEETNNYIKYLDAATTKITDGAAALGALRSRIDSQTEFTRSLMASLDKGIGRLVDADMNEESVRLKALQTQQNLAAQSLQIANTASENIISLFR
jgi:flagellin